MSHQYWQSQAYRRGFFTYSSTDHASPVAAVLSSVTISKAGASFVYAAGVVSPFSNGYNTIALTTGDTDTVGSLGFHMTGSGIDAVQFVDQVLPGVQVATIVQAVKDDVVNQIWATAVRSVTSVSSPVGVASNYDKNNYTLTTAGVQAVSDLMVNAIWATPVRVVTSVSSPVGVASNYDKGNYTLTTAGTLADADALLGRNVAGGSSTGRTVSQALFTLRNKVDLLGGIVYGTDDTTPSWTFVVASDTSTTRIITVDPA